jgi:hypothetical protein
MAHTKTQKLAQPNPRKSKGKRPPRPRSGKILLAALVAAVGIGAVAWQATGHGGAPSGPKAATGSTAAPATAGSPSGAPAARVPESAFASQPPFTGPAVTTFGQAALQTAYRQAVNFAFDTGWNSALMSKRKRTLTSLDFSSARSGLTATCAKRFDSTVSKALVNDKAAIRALESAMFFAIEAPGGLKPLDGKAAVTNRRFTRATVAVDKSTGHDRLSVTFTAKAHIHLQNAAGKQYVVQTERTVRYLLVPNTGADAKTRPFLIDAWANHLRTSKPAAA